MAAVAKSAPSIVDSDADTYPCRSRPYQHCSIGQALALRVIQGQGGASQSLVAANTMLDRAALRVCCFPPVPEPITPRFPLLLGSGRRRPCREFPLRVAKHIDDAASYERSAVIDPNDDVFVSLEHRHAHPGPEGYGPMGATKRVCVKRFTRRSSSTLGVIGRQTDFPELAS
jgi:hypothetical protein